MTGTGPLSAVANPAAQPLDAVPDLLAALPDVPTAAESGMEDYVATSWTTVAVSSKVPDAGVKKLSEDIRKVVNPEAMSNPGCLGWYAERAAQAAQEAQSAQANSA